MPIHNNAEFESFLAGVRVVRGPTDLPNVELTGWPKECICLVYPSQSLKLETVLNVIKKELAAGGCVATRSAAIATLALIAETRPADGSAVAHANERLQRVRTGMMHLTVVTIRKPDGGYRAQIGSCELVPFDPQALLHWGKRTNSTWPIDLRSLRGQLAIQQTPFAVKVLDWNDELTYTALIRRWSRKEIIECLFDATYQATFHHFRLEIGVGISKELLVLEACSVVSDHRHIVAEFGSRSIGLIVFDDRTGWALLGESGIRVNTTPARTFGDGREWLTNEFGFTRFDPERPIDGTASMFCEFLRRAQRHRISGLYDEAFLLFIVALDLLFGERNALGDNVACRAATVTHRAMGFDWVSHRKRVRELYDSRSRYVHEGKSPSEGALRDVEKVCLEVLWALLRACGRRQVHDAGTWTRRIDFVRASIEADKHIDAEELSQLGIADGRVDRTPPNRVLDDLEYAASGDSGRNND